MPETLLDQAINLAIHGIVTVALFLTALIVLLAALSAFTRFIAGRTPSDTRTSTPKPASTPSTAATPTPEELAAAQAAARHHHQKMESDHGKP
jgi:Na+-transporting methylmalonyl-CoA/oxaloacetate decarboxylase gamma subunit